MGGVVLTRVKLCTTISGSSCPFCRQRLCVPHLVEEVGTCVDIIHVDTYIGALGFLLIISQVRQLWESLAP